MKVPFQQSKMLSKHADIIKYDVQFLLGMIHLKTVCLKRDILPNKQILEFEITFPVLKLGAYV